jgi:hypothetical protein
MRLVRQSLAVSMLAVVSCFHVGSRRYCCLLRKYRSMERRPAVGRCRRDRGLLLAAGLSGEQLVESRYFERTGRSAIAGDDRVDQWANDAESHGHAPCSSRVRAAALRYPLRGRGREPGARAGPVLSLWR